MTVYPLNGELKAAEADYIRCLEEWAELNKNRQAPESQRSAAFNRLMEAKRRLAALKPDSI